MAAPLLTVTDLSVQFDRDQVLAPTSFTLQEGGVLAIIGPTGAGKSVLVRSLMGMLSHGGAITWSRPVRIGYVPQKSEADRHLPINPHDLLMAKAKVIGVPEAQVNEIVSRVDLTPQILQVPVGHLSGGQFQRGLIAFALVGSPDVLIMDEPTASIDKPGGERVYELLHRLQDQLHMTLIVVSHELNFVYRYATQVLCVDRGGLCYGVPAEILTPELLGRLYGSYRYFHHLQTMHSDHE